MRRRGRTVPSDDLHQEPRASHGCRCSAGAAQGSGQGGTAAALTLSRPLHGGRHAAGSLGSHKSYRPRDEQPPSGGGRNRDADPRSRRGQAFQGERRSRETHASTTDPEARLYRKGKQQGAQLCYLGHVLGERRHGLVVDVELTQADGDAEREAALTMLERSSLPRT